LFSKPGSQPIYYAVLEGESYGIYIMDRVASLLQNCFDGWKWDAATSRHLYPVETFLCDMRYQPPVLYQSCAAVVSYMYSQHEAGTACARR
jgi:hypothetical protein